MLHLFQHLKLSIEIPKQVRDDTESGDDMASRDDTGSRNGITQKTEMTHPDMLCLCLED